MTSEPETIPVFSDDDLVYVDPQKKMVIGPIEFTKKGTVEKKEMLVEVESTDASEKPKRRRSPKKRYYPWCSYKTAKKIYRVEGKYIEPDNHKPFEEVLSLALDHAFWD